MNTLGKKIRLLRHQRSWSQEDVAKQLDISIPAFSKIETGITDVNLSRLEQVSALFGLTVVQLLTFTSVMSSSFSPGLLDGNPPPRWGAPGEDQADSYMQSARVVLNGCRP
jgi:transcriptional regulator with XRE-family HTH domain